MVDALNAKTLRINFMMALVTSIVCGFFAKILSNSSPNFLNSVPKHVIKVPHNFDSIQKTHIVKFQGNVFPNSTYLSRFHELKVDSIIIDFPGVEGLNDQWKDDFANFIREINSFGIKFAFFVKQGKSRSPDEIKEDIKSIHDNYITDSYFKLDDRAFIVFEISGFSQSVRSILREPFCNSLFPCAMIDDRDDVKKGYEDGFGCFMSVANPNTGSFSANPKNWEELKRICDGHGSLFIPVVQNVFYSSQNRIYDFKGEIPEESDDEEEKELPESDDDEDSDKEMHGEFHEGRMDSEDYHKREEMRREKLEEKRRKRERSRHEEIMRREERRKERRAAALKKADPRSNFQYAWEFATQASKIISVQTARNEHWIFDDADEFVKTSEKLLMQ